LLLAAELGVKIAADKLKEWIGRIFFHERARYLEGALVLVIVVVEVDGQIEARLLRSEKPRGNSVLQLTNAFLLAATGNAHEKSKNACGSG
jgi:hypothetical protein